MKRILLLIVVIGLASANTGQTQHAIDMAGVDLQAERVRREGNVLRLDEVTVVIAGNRISAETGLFHVETREVLLNGNVRLLPAPGNVTNVGLPSRPTRLVPATKD